MHQPHITVLRWRTSIVSVGIFFLSVSHSTFALFVREFTVMSVLSGRNIFSMFKTWNVHHRTKELVGWTVAMRWHAFCLEFVHALSCTFWVRFRTCPVELISGWTTTQHETYGTDVQRTKIDKKNNVLSVLHALIYRFTVNLFGTHAIMSVH